MRKFEELDKRNIHEVETDILNKWKDIDILEKTIENRKSNEDYVFYDGPIYANAKPGIHHVLAKTIKDSFCKYQTMKGYRVLRKIGLDTHGLPIEVNVEKKLGFKSKADIEKFGVENFCKECNKATATNIDEVNKVTDMMGQFIDQKDPYITCTNDYIESEWWIIKQMHEKGLLYHGNKVLWYCPRCGTELSANEVSQGYEETSVNTVIVPLKKIDEDVYFLAWTTTPWTLLANVAICVNPNLTYIKVESMGYKFILAEELANKVLGDEYRIIETYKGTDLVGMKYEQLMPFVKVDGKCHEVIADNYVTATDGTGIVHIAPAYGDDDNRVCRENGIGFVNPVGLDGCYTVGPWEGRLVTDPELEIDIIKWLKENDKLFKKIKITHDYPHCWRCHSPLISYPKPAWYIETTKYKDEIIKANKNINWYPDYVGEKRFNNWLENMVDWGISRNRYWGCPLPVWTNNETVEMDVPGVNQVQVNSEIGLTFANVLRSILRQDPDIIMIGEIRDDETATIAVRASITGHLVLSTLHTNDSLNTIERLLDMDVERYLLAASLSGIVSQKLARKLCPNCRKKIQTNQYQKYLFKKNLGIDLNEIYIAGNGCEQCMNGYKGRIAIHEVLLIDEDIRDAISNNIKKDQLKELVYKGDVKTLLQDGLLKVANGLTTFEEIIRLIELDAEDIVLPTVDTKENIEVL